MTHAHDHANWVGDAQTRRDPTGTRPVRSAFRRDLESRWKNLKKVLRAQVVEQDMLGLAGVVSPQASEAGGAHALFGRWFSDVAYQLVLERTGSWVGAHVRRAYVKGLNDAIKEVSPTRPSTIAAPGSDLYASFAVAELEGVVDATVQQVQRAAGDAITSRSKPGAAARAMAERIDKIGVTRSEGLVNFIVVRAYNEGKLESYRRLGIARVGVDPETVPRRVVRDAPRRRRRRRATGRGSLNLVEVLTAGDDDVCPECEDISRAGPYDLAVASGLIPAHPNCRCAFVPLDDARFAEVERED